MQDEVLFLGVDGGGTRCRARLASAKGTTLGEGLAGPANIRFGLNESFAAVLDAAGQCFANAGLPIRYADTVACLALAGASEPVDLEAARRTALPFRQAVLTTDAHAACMGAHGGTEGGVVIVGTGAVGFGVAGGAQHRIGGWGFPVSDEGSGAWLGCELARRVLSAHDGRTSSTPLLVEAFARFQSKPHAIVRWMSAAKPRDFAALAPLVVAHASRGDTIACELLAGAARHIGALAAGLLRAGVTRISLAGGLAPFVKPWLGAETQRSLVEPRGDALDGALLLARRDATPALAA